MTIPNIRSLDLGAQNIMTYTKGSSFQGVNLDTPKYQYQILWIFGSWGVGSRYIMVHIYIYIYMHIFLDISANYDDQTGG